MAQGSVEWLKLRLGRPTASEFARFIKANGEGRESDKRMTYVYEKAAEKWQRHALPGFGSFATERGQDFEAEAVAWYEFEHNVELRRVGFIESEDRLSGCSPDALCGEEYGVEIKCPQAPAHVRYCCEGRLPADYAPQVHGSLYVTGLPEWRFLSYHRGFPPLLLIVKRDEEIMERIGNALATFQRDFKAALAALAALKQAST